RKRAGRAPPPPPPIQPAEKEGGGLQPLPPLLKTQLRGSGPVHWAAATVKNLTVFTDGQTQRGPDWPPMDVVFTVTVFDNGSAAVRFSFGSISVYFKGRFSKSAALVDIK
ncbi:MAG: hypothetical protein FWG09_01675, partial [Synergistaceae bacterium]|nr:hypothetical protein [Synergistaceae bacterium]